MSSKSFLKSSALFLGLAFIQSAAAANSSCAPGGKFDLTNFKLGLPTGESGDPDTISSSSLDGCDGYTSKYFFTDAEDGSLVMKVPGSPASSGCVTTANSLHCRTELRESNPADWSPSDSVNRLSATLTVLAAGGNTCVGQIHIEESVSVRPVCELYYKDNGDLIMGVEQTRAGGNQKLTTVGNVPLNTTFSYEIRYEGGKLSVQINDEGFKTLSTYELDNPSSYFKVGNYLQGSKPSEVHFHNISITHGGSSSDDKREVVARPQRRAARMF